MNHHHWFPHLLVRSVPYHSHKRTSQFRLPCVPLYNTINHVYLVHVPITRFRNINLHLSLKCDVWYWQASSRYRPSTAWHGSVWTCCSAQLPSCTCAPSAWTATSVYGTRWSSDAIKPGGESPLRSSSCGSSPSPWAFHSASCTLR